VILTETNRLTRWALQPTESMDGRPPLRAISKAINYGVYQMDLSAILLARVFGFVDMNDLNPRGKIYLHEIVPTVVEEFQFQSYPQKREEFDENKGVVFLLGKWAGINIEKLTIYGNGLMIDTRSSTDDSSRLLEELLTWAAQQFGTEYKQGMISKRRYLSQLTFYSNAPLLVPATAISRLSERVSQSVKSILGDSLPYLPNRLDLHFDHSEENRPIAPFTIQRRGQAAFSENKYFSEAPMPTNQHWELLQAYETDL